MFQAISSQNHSNISHSEISLSTQNCTTTREKLDSLALRFFSSNIWIFGSSCILGAAALAGVTTLVAYNVSTTALLLTTLLAGTIITGLFINAALSLRQRALSLDLTLQKDWWNPITSHLILGAMPLDHHLEALTGIEKVNSVITILEPFETRLYFATAIAANDWKSKGISSKWISSQDCKSVPVEKLREGVEWIHQEIQQNKKVYVHCKHGIGRSASVIAAYLLRYGIGSKKFSSANEALNYIKQRRPQINFPTDSTVKTYMEMYC